MSGNRWVISDTHFFHENIIRYCGRPFANATEMNEALIENWNSTVKGGDIVYHLGDVGMGHHAGLDKVLRVLPGRKRLVLGKHDELGDGVLGRYFEKVTVWRTFRDEGLMFTHIPVHRWNINEKYAMVNIHGHIHEKLIDDPLYVNVCVEHTNYKPIAFEELKTWKSKRVIDTKDIIATDGPRQDTPWVKPSEQTGNSYEQQ